MTDECAKTNVPEEWAPSACWRHGCRDRSLTHGRQSTCHVCLLYIRLNVSCEVNCAKLHALYTLLFWSWSCIIRFTDNLLIPAISSIFVRKEIMIVHITCTKVSETYPFFQTYSIGLVMQSVMTWHHLQSVWWAMQATAAHIPQQSPQVRGTHYTFLSLLELFSWSTACPAIMCLNFFRVFLLLLPVAFCFFK